MQLCTDIDILVSNLHEFLAIEEFASTFVITDSREESKPPVDADDMVHVIASEIWDIFRDGDMEEPLLAERHQFARTEAPAILEILRKCFMVIHNFDARAERVHGERGSIINEAVIPTAYKISLRTTKADRLPKPFQRSRNVFPFRLAIFIKIRLILVLIWLLCELRLSRLVSCRSSTEDGIGELGFQAKLIANIVI